MQGSGIPPCTVQATSQGIALRPAWRCFAMTSADLVSLEDAPVAEQHCPEIDSVAQTVMNLGRRSARTECLYVSSM